MTEASAIAYQGGIKPVEGTSLTVAREAADAAVAAAEENNDLLYVLERTVTEARHSVARTPSLLQVLADAGVVDAGGQGLFIILDGALRFMRGEEVGELPIVEAGIELEAPVEEEYGYETMFILKGEDLNIEEIREAIAAMGESVLVVGDSRAVKVHIHSMEPGRPLDYAAKLGTLIQISVENLQEQYQEFVRHRGATVPGHPPPPPVAEELGDTAIVVVAPGEGLARVFESLGVSAVVPGGQSMNPSTQQILEAIEGIYVEKVIVLPNKATSSWRRDRRESFRRKRWLSCPPRPSPRASAQSWLSTIKRIWRPTPR